MNPSPGAGTAIAPAMPGASEADDDLMDMPQERARGGPAVDPIRAGTRFRFAAVPEPSASRPVRPQHCRRIRHGDL